MWPLWKRCLLGARADSEARLHQFIHVLYLFFLHIEWLQRCKRHILTRYYPWSRQSSGACYFFAILLHEAQRIHLWRVEKEGWNGLALLKYVINGTDYGRGKWKCDSFGWQISSACCCRYNTNHFGQKTLGLPFGIRYYKNHNSVRHIQCSCYKKISTNPNNNNNPIIQYL